MHFVRYSVLQNEFPPFLLIEELKVFCNGEQINVTTSYKYLGTLLDQNLWLSTDFEQKYKRASTKLGLLRKLLQYFTLDATKLLYSSVSVSTLRFNGIVHLNLNQTQLAKSKSLERRADALLETKTVPIKNEFDKQAVLVVRKCLDKNICSNFYDYFALNQHVE